MERQTETDRHRVTERIYLNESHKRSYRLKLRTI